MTRRKCDGELFCTVLIPNKLCYPNYYNIRRQNISILKRYNDLEKSLNSCTGFGRGFSEPSFVILEGSEGSRIERALFPNDETSKCSKKVTHTIKRASILAEITSKDIVLLPSESSYDLSDIIRSMGDVKCFIVACKSINKARCKERFKGCSNVQVLMLSEVKDAANLAVEEIIFRPMKGIAEKLAQLLETNTKPNSQKENIKHRRRKSKSGKAKRGKTKCIIKTRQTMNTLKLAKTKGYITRSKLQEIIGNEFREKIESHRNTMERLLNEISGMYNRSKISVHQKPQISACLDRNVSDNVANELYAVDLSVKSCGYRFSTLQVFVDDTSNKQINDKIKTVLQKNGIVKYEIVRSIETFKPLLKVGAKCYPDQKSPSYGTVGGFATKSGNDLCALVSWHVALHALCSSDGNVSLSDNHETIRARLIKETVPPKGDKVDLSAALIGQRDVKRCNKRFRDEDGDPAKGLDCSYDAKDLDSRNVHIWGASTAPGLGIITMSKIRHRYADNTFIVVEDRPGHDKEFCREGDSGAMVCADDINGEGVDLISMVMGEDNEGKYATCRLDKGLEQLKRQTSEDFSLCKD